MDKPTLTVYLPQVESDEDGGGDCSGRRVFAPVDGQGGRDVAQWLNAHGVAAFVLKYRLGPKYHHPIELGDAQRAIRTVRAEAAEYGIATDHIGMWGSRRAGTWRRRRGRSSTRGSRRRRIRSSGGSRPDFLVLAYPVITLRGSVGAGGRGSICWGRRRTRRWCDALSAETQVTTQTPPTFLFTTTDDKTVPVLNSVMFYTALVKAAFRRRCTSFSMGRMGRGWRRTIRS